MTHPTQPPTSDEIASYFRNACEAELRALKPGNVHVFAPGHDMDVAHFRAAATAAAPFIADPNLSVGARVKSAVHASMEAAGCNTNLGIILLSAPLAAAASCQGLAGSSLQDRLTACLQSLTSQDADDVFAAIRQANPGGLGAAPKGDVHDPNTKKDLLHAMGLSADLDRIARAYVTNFTDIFAHHLPALRAASKTRASFTPTSPQVVTMLFMQILVDFPDSHVMRKFDAETAGSIQTRARELRPLWHPELGGPDLPEALPALLLLDKDLKAEGLNPGTTADFVVATVFADQLIRRFDAH